jgi:hypothetical protein
MAIAVVQSQGTLTYSGSGSTSGDPTRTDNTFSSAVTTGNAVVVIEWISNYGNWASTITTGAVTDNKGNTYQRVFSLTTTNNVYRNPEVLQMYVAYNVTGGSSFSTISNASSYAFCCCCNLSYVTLYSSMISYEISGLGASNPIGAYSTNQGSYLSNPSSGSITNSPNAILIGCAGLDSNNSGGPANPWTGTSGFTGPVTSPPPTASSSPIPLAAEYQIVASSSSYSSSMTASQLGANWWYAKAIASFKASGATTPNSNFMVFF